MIEEVQLIAKDKTIAAAYAPDDGERDELVVVVQVAIDLFFADEPWKPLNAVGFGSTRDPVTVPLVPVYVAAVARRMSYYLRDANHRVVVCRSLVSASGGLRLVLNCEQHWVQAPGEYAPAGGEMGAADNKGETQTMFRLDGDIYFGNLFLWYDEFSNSQPNQYKNGHRTRDIALYLAVLLEDTSHNEGYQACLSAFGRVGFPADRRMRWVTTPIGKHSNAQDLRLFGSPNAPRLTSESGVVTGQVTLLDEANLSAKIDATTGLIAIATTNANHVPLSRAADIQRAMNSLVGYASVILAHELGHLLGAAASFSASSRAFPMPDGAGPGPYMNQDEEGHDKEISATGLMVAGDKVPPAQQLGVVGPERAFRTVQSAYLRAVAPRASALATEVPR